MDDIQVVEGLRFFVVQSRFFCDNKNLFYENVDIEKNCSNTM